MGAFPPPRAGYLSSRFPTAPCSRSCASLSRHYPDRISSSRLLCGIAQIFDPIMRAFDLAVLTRNDIAHRRHKIIAHRLFELLHSRVFTTLTLGKDCALVFAGDSGFKLIHPRCIAPAALPPVSGSASPTLLASVWSSLAKRDRCCEYSVKSDLSCGSFTASAASLKPFCPSLRVSIRLLIVEIVSFLICHITLNHASRADGLDFFPRRKFQAV